MQGHGTRYKTNGKVQGARATCKGKCTTRGYDFGGNVRQAEAQNKGETGNGQKARGKGQGAKAREKLHRQGLKGRLKRQGARCKLP
jgi:hypothetical protein